MYIPVKNGEYDKEDDDSDGVMIWWYQNSSALLSCWYCPWELYTLLLFDPLDYNLLNFAFPMWM